jgi:hypothetical protein
MVPPQGENPWRSCIKHPRAHGWIPRRSSASPTCCHCPSGRCGSSHPTAAPRARWCGARGPGAILAALYTGVVGFALLRHGLDPRAFGTLAGVMKLFASPWVALAGWVHYLCFDLFVARWMLHDAPTRATACRRFSASRCCSVRRDCCATSHCGRGCRPSTCASDPRPIGDPGQRRRNAFPSLRASETRSPIATFTSMRCMPHSGVRSPPMLSMRGSEGSPFTMSDR